MRKLFYFILFVIFNILIYSIDTTFILSYILLIHTYVLSPFYFFLLYLLAYSRYLIIILIIYFFLCYYSIQYKGYYIPSFFGISMVYVKYRLYHYNLILYFRFYYYIIIYFSSLIIVTYCILNELFILGFIFILIYYIFVNYNLYKIIKNNFILNLLISLLILLYINYIYEYNKIIINKDKEDITDIIWKTFNMRLEYKYAYFNEQYGDIIQRGNKKIKKKDYNSDNSLLFKEFVEQKIIWLNLKLEKLYNKFLNYKLKLYYDFKLSDFRNFKVDKTDLELDYLDNDNYLNVIYIWDNIDNMTNTIESSYNYNDYIYNMQYYNYNDYIYEGIKVYESFCKDYNNNIKNRYKNKYKNYAKYKLMLFDELNSFRFYLPLSKLYSKYKWLLNRWSINTNLFYDEDFFNIDENEYNIYYEYNYFNKVRRYNSFSFINHYIYDLLDLKKYKLDHQIYNHSNLYYNNNLINNYLEDYLLNYYYNIDYYNNLSTITLNEILIEKEMNKISFNYKDYKKFFDSLRFREKYSIMRWFNAVSVVSYKSSKDWLDQSYDVSHGDIRFNTILYEDETLKDDFKSLLLPSIQAKDKSLQELYAHSYSYNNRLKLKLIQLKLNDYDINNIYDYKYTETK